MYSLKEIIDIAIQMEQAGYDFYKANSEKFSGDIYHETFNFLAEQERLHKEKFEELLENVENNQGEYNDEYYLYMKSLGGDKVFKKSDVKDIMEFIKTPQDALLKGMEDEKNSIFYYGEIKRLYSQESSEALIIDAIIEEERSHIMKLALLHSKLTAL